MSFLFSPSDDEPARNDWDAPQKAHLSTLRRDRRVLDRLLDDVERMLQGQIAGDTGFRGPGCGITLNAALDHMQRTLAGTLELMRPDVNPPQPRQHFGRRKPGALPSVVSPETVA
jgi:hypothetical protein